MVLSLMHNKILLQFKIFCNILSIEITYIAIYCFFNWKLYLQKQTLSVPVLSVYQTDQLNNTVDKTCHKFGMHLTN